jgi:hypothetical protein
MMLFAKNWILYASKNLRKQIIFSFILFEFRDLLAHFITQLWVSGTGNFATTTLIPSCGDTELIVLALSK